MAGAALIVLWALTAESGGIRIVGTGDSDLLDPFTGLLRLVELVARLLTTTAVFSHLLLQITETHWRHEREFAVDATFKHHELQMAQVEHTLRVTGDRAD